MKSLIAALLLSILVAVPGAGQSPDSAQSTVFRSGTNMVALNVTVLDPRQQYVAGLTQGDFAVFEDGIQQQVRFFEAQDIPVDLIVLIDTSSSMRDKMDAVHEAAIGFLKTLKNGDRGAVVAFSDGVEVLQTLTPDHRALETAIRATAAHGSTSLHNALYVALKQFARPGGGDAELRRQAIAVLSDGEDTSSLITFDDVLQLARKSGVTIYTIGLQSKPAGPRGSSSLSRSFSTADYSMKSLAQETGAQAFFPQHIGDLKSVYATIAQELASQYALAYSPANSRSDGRFRRIVVQVTSRPELRLRTRAGYMAEADRSRSSIQR